MEKNREYSLKIPSSYENVFDTMFIDLSYMLSPMFKDNNYNPNMLTTLSVIFGIKSKRSLGKTVLTK